MERVRRLGRAGKLLLALGVSGAVFGIATAVQASIPDASGVIHGCYNASLAHGSPVGGLRVIDTAKVNGNCASWEAPLNWNATGVTGPTGAEGATGPTGATGPSDGWSAGVSGTVPTGGGTVELTGGATGIPAGSYLISGQIDASRIASGSADVWCNFTGSALVGTGSASATFFVSTAADVSAPFTGGMIALDTTTLTVFCGEFSGSSSVFVSGWVNAIRVGTLH
jgi:hypothetical protein